LTVSLTLVIEFIFDILPNESKYTAVLTPGEYIINASSVGYKELSEYFVVTKGACIGEFKLEKKEPASLSITAVDVLTGKVISGVLLKLSAQNRTMNVENLTNSEGKVEYKTSGLGYYTLAVSREGYVQYSKELCISKTSLKDIVVPLIPLAKETDRSLVQVCLSGDTGVNNLSFTVYCPLSTLY
jgi:hypothetical protein